MRLSSPLLDTTSELLCDDMVMLTEHGFVLLGRADRTVKLEEKRLHLGEVEFLLLEHECVAEVRCILVAGKRSVLGAVIVPSSRGNQVLENQGKPVLVGLLKSHLSQHLEAVLLPRKWRFVSHFPYNSQSKLDMDTLMELFT